MSSIETCASSSGAGLGAACGACVSSFLRISRAREILKKLETQAPQAAPRPAPEDDAQVSMLDMGAGELRRALEAVTVETLTPIEAMNVLYKLKQML